MTYNLVKVGKNNFPSPNVLILLNPIFLPALESICDAKNVRNI